MLLDALEKLAGARGTTQLSVDASDTARDFFDRADFRPAAQHRLASATNGLQHHDGETACRATRTGHERPDTPFPRHWRYYIVLKYVVLAAAVALALYDFGVW